MPTPQITIIGSLNTDLITRTPRLPSPGETLLSHSFATGSGGKGANQALACARLSRPQTSSTPQNPIVVKMIGAVGNDTFGQTLLSDLENNGIDISGVKKKEGEKSGVAVIIVDELTGENRILMSPGANFSLRPGDFKELGVPLPELLVLQFEIPREVTVEILRVAKRDGVEVVLNPAPAQVLPREAWEGVEHLIVNESEAAIVTESGEGHVEWGEWGEHVERIVDLGVRHVTITLGAEGVVYIDTLLRRSWRYRAHRVNVVDTTAAGDTFVGAYAVAVIRQKGHKGNVAAAVKWANLAAAKTVERKGTQAAIPWSDEVEAFDVDGYEEGWVQR